MRSNENVDMLLLLTVPAPRSGSVVNALRQIPGVVAAAAVYSGIDVVAQLRGTRQIIDAARETIRKNLSSRVIETQEIEVQDILPGPRFHDPLMAMRGYCHAYIDCTVAPEELHLAAAVFQNLPFVCAAFVSDSSNRLVLEVLTSSKDQFDEAVMSSVQDGSLGMAQSTRSYVVINTMRWADWLVTPQPTIFMSYAMSGKDREIATALKLAIEADTDVNCWIADDDIKPADGDWWMTIAAAMKTAPLHLYLMSESHARSGECQREYGRSLEIVRFNQDVCLLLLPGMMPEDMPDPYKRRNVIIGDGFLAYAKLLEWIRSRLAVARPPRGHQDPDGLASPLEP